MNCTLNIDAGICGFETAVTASCEDSMTVTFDFDTPCEKVTQYACALSALGPIDAYAQLAPGQSQLLEFELIKPCCKGCIVPNAAFKALQVAAGLALPKSAHINI